MVERAGVRVHPTAEVSPDAVIGPGTSIWNQAQVREDARIGAELRDRQERLRRCRRRHR